MEKRAPARLAAIAFRVAARQAARIAPPIRRESKCWPAADRMNTRALWRPRVGLKREFAQWLAFSGQGRDRTGDTRIFSPLLYQLSYLS